MYFLDDAKIPGRDYIEYVVQAGKKTIKHEDSLVRQILYTCLSSQTAEPINLGIIAPTSEGKTYPVIECLKFVPKSDVWLIGSMSTKVLVRQRAVMVGEDNRPVGDRIKEIKKELATLKKENAENEGVEDRIAELEAELEHVRENTKYLIDLRGKTLVFLEPPQHELWDLLKPILSHDNFEIEYPYVDKTEQGFHVKKMVTIGWPACIFCSAKDESHWPAWPEIASRFITTSPNMKSEKYHDSNILIAQRKGLPNLIQQHIIISEQEEELARECYRYIKDEIAQLCGGITGRNPVWIPFAEVLAEALPHNKGTDVRVNKRIFSFLELVPLARAHLRPKLVLGSGVSAEKMVIATLDDLSEVLAITQNLAGIPPYKLQFYRDVFCPCYLAKTEPDVKDGKAEDRIAVTSSQLCDFLKFKTGKMVTTNSIKSTYLDELVNAGYIDKAESQIDRRQYVYWPVVELPEIGTGEKIKKYNICGAPDNYTRFVRLYLPNNCKNIPDNWLILEILSLMKYLDEPGKMRIMKDGKVLSVREFVEEYEKSERLAGYFVRRRKWSIFAELKPLKQYSATIDTLSR